MCLESVYMPHRYWAVWRVHRLQRARGGAGGGGGQGHQCGGGRYCGDDQDDPRDDAGAFFAAAVAVAGAARS